MINFFPLPFDNVWELLESFPEIVRNIWKIDGKHFDSRIRLYIINEGPPEHRVPERSCNKHNTT